jgi:sulfonate transport system ATP-binding protein
MAQRVALARALFSRPDLLLLDEPFSAVDAFTRKKLQDLLLTLTRAHGTAALLVTHDLDEARRVSDRIFLMTRSAEQQTGFVLREVDESVSMSDLDVQ